MGLWWVHSDGKSRSLNVLGLVTRTTALETELQGNLWEKPLGKTDFWKDEQPSPLLSGFGIIYHCLSQQWQCYSAPPSPVPPCHTSHVPRELYTTIMSSPVTRKCTCLTPCLAVNLALYPSGILLIHLLTCPPLWWQSLFLSSLLQKSLWQTARALLASHPQPHRSTLYIPVNWLNVPFYKPRLSVLTSVLPLFEFLYTGHSLSSS